MSDDLAVNLPVHTDPPPQDPNTDDRGKGAASYPVKGTVKGGGKPAGGGPPSGGKPTP